MYDKVKCRRVIDYIMNILEASKSNVITITASDLQSVIEELNIHDFNFFNVYGLKKELGIWDYKVIEREKKSIKVQRMESTTDFTNVPLRLLFHPIHLHI